VKPDRPDGRRRSGGCSGCSRGRLTPSPTCVSIERMTQPQPQPVKVNLVRRADFREGYANSVQMRVNLWDFHLEFGTVNQTSPEAVNIETFPGIYLSPQQAKALLNVLQQHGCRAVTLRTVTLRAGKRPPPRAALGVPGARRTAPVRFPPARIRRPARNPHEWISAFHAGVCVLRSSALRLRSPSC
jgi:Protein of unknown function (DUF3467)